MIQPTVSHMVWYHPHHQELLAHGLPYPSPLAAIIVCVWTNRMVNLTVFDANGVPHARPSVWLIQDDDVVPADGGAYCEWMPYQKGQAAKTEQLEAKLGSSSP